MSEEENLVTVELTDLDDATTEIVNAVIHEGELRERERIIAVLEHQEVWNSVDEKWTHPSYCLTCRNIERINGTYDGAV